MQKPHPVFRLLPSAADFAFLMPAVFLFLRLNGAKRLLMDGDTGWHVRTGEWILAHHAIPRQDFFSFTKPGAPWFAWEWLWDLCFGWLHLHWGMAAVVLASVLILCACSLLVFQVARKVSGEPVLALAAMFLAMAASAVHWLARPHLVTLLFTAAWMAMLAGMDPAVAGGALAEGGAREEVRPQRASWRGLFWMPPLTVLWVNLHGGFFVGILLLAMCAAGSALEWAFQPARREKLAWARRYGLTAAACLAVSLINPYGYRLHVHIFEYFRDSYLLQAIQEFQTMSFHAVGAGFFESLLALAVLAAGWNLVKRRFTPAILVAAWGHMALIAARNIPLFAFVAAPVVAGAGAEMLASVREGFEPQWFARRVEDLRSVLAEFGAVDRLPRAYALSVLGVLVLAVGLLRNTGPAGSKWQASFDENNFPVAAAERLAAQMNSRRIFTTDQWGDYLIYRFYPSGGKVFIDGRSDFYGSDFGNAYLDVLSVNYKWPDVLGRYSVDTVLIPVANPLSGALKNSSRWRVAYDDGKAIIFVSSKFSTHSGNICDAGSSPKEVTGGSQFTTDTKERTNL